ncbi:SirB2 family protein [Colwellia ponticola]|nr:SirB2 family protein [Colwellia ponticola]
MMIKHTHLTIIALTFILFVISFVLTIRASDKANNKLLKVAPHILYTFFIGTIIYLAAVNPLNLYPIFNGWASAKLAGFVFYVLSIAFALKWAKTTLWRIAGFLSAVFWLAMTARLGFADHLKVENINEQATTYIELARSILTVTS